MYNKNHNLEMITCDLEQNIMRRVRFICFIRKLGRPLVVDSFVVAVATVVSCNFWVSLPDLAINLKTALSGGGFVNYSISAVKNAEWLLQSIIGAITVLAIYRTVVYLRSAKFPMRFVPRGWVAS